MASRSRQGSKQPTQIVDRTKKSKAVGLHTLFWDIDACVINSSPMTFEALGIFRMAEMTVPVGQVESARYGQVTNP